MATATGTNTNIGTKETFLDRNAKLIPSDETTMALTNAKWIAGHHTVAKVKDLYQIYPFILNPKYYAGTDEDDANHTETIGQLWYVVEDNSFYQLIDWDNRGNANGWSKTNIKSAHNPNGNNNEQHIGPNDFITKISITGDGKLTGLTGTFTNSTSSSSYNNIATKIVIPDNTQILTNVNIDHSGKLSYTYGIRPVLSVTRAAETAHSYTSSQPNLQFDVVDGIDVNDHNITYHHSTITTLSQSHHGGSFNGDFLTSASLSSTGTLSGTSKTFQNQQTNNTGKITNLGVGQTINYDNAQVITYSYIDHNGKLWTEASALRQPVHQISVVSNANKVTLSYNGISNGNNKSTKYDIDLPIASSTNAGIITGSTYTYFDDKIQSNKSDIDSIYNGDKPLVNPVITTTKYTIYKADGITQLSTGTSNPSNIDYGSWIEWEGTFKWTHNDNYKDPTSTSGSFGTTLPASNVASSSVKYAKKQLTSSVIFASQSLSAPKKGLMLVGQKILKASGNDSTSTSIGIDVFKKRYWGFVENRSTITSATILSLGNSENTGSKGKTFAKDATKTGPIGSGKVYFIYAYPATSGKLTQASVPGADATGWFNISVNNGGPLTVAVTNATNGYTENYYVYYSLGQNALSGAALTFA